MVSQADLPDSKIMVSYSKKGGVVANKTQENDADVSAFLDSIENLQRREDTRAICEMMARISGAPAKMWGVAIIGFGKYHYKYESGREGDFMRVGVSPRKAATTIYILPGYTDFGDILARLGKHKKGKSCLYINKLSEVDSDVLEELIVAGLEDMKARYGD